MIDTTTQMQDGKGVVIAHGPTDNVHTAQDTLAITARKRDGGLVSATHLTGTPVLA